MNKHKHHIVFLTGAGISQESGISTFRDANGLSIITHILENFCKKQDYNGKYNTIFH